MTILWKNVSIGQLLACWPSAAGRSTSVPPRHFSAGTAGRDAGFLADDAPQEKLDVWRVERHDRRCPLSVADDWKRVGRRRARTWARRSGRGRCAAGADSGSAAEVVVAVAVSARDAQRPSPRGRRQRWCGFGRSCRRGSSLQSTRRGDRPPSGVHDLMGVACQRERAQRVSSQSACPLDVEHLSTWEVGLD